jgi:hypothetical protein
MTDDVRKAAADAARSMRDRAIRVLLGRAVIPCALMMRGAANEIESLPLLEEFDVANQPNQPQQPAQGGPKKAVDVAALIQLLGQLASKIPAAAVLVEHLIDLFRAKQGAQALPRCPNDDLHKCCEETLKSALQTAFLAAQGCDCCDPDAGG